MAGAAGYSRLCFGLRTSEGTLSLDAERGRPPRGHRRAGRPVLAVLPLVTGQPIATRSRQAG